MRTRRLPLLAFLGPGLMVMLADTDAGCVVTAAQSGATWGYRLLLVQVLLVPVLYLVLELAVRLALTTGKGLTELIRDELGPAWTAVAVATLAVSVLGALVTEFAGLAGVGALFGLPRAAVVGASAALLVLLVVTGGYRRVEVVGIALGSLELVFVGAALAAHPDPAAVASGLSPVQPYGDPGYFALLAANVGAVVMPWMLFYQPTAVLQKGLTRWHLRAARIDTAVGAVVTQLVMVAVLVAAAASLHGGGSLESIGSLAAALTPALGSTAGRVVLALGISGAALVAAIVVSLAASWSVAEAFGKPRRLGDGIRRARLFYGAYAAVVAAGAGIVLASDSLVRLSVDVEILNALLLPVLFALLAVLARRALPAPYRLAPRRRFALVAVTGPVAAVALVWVGIALGL
ncbi:MAG TPA: divalent metal cation transporter [Gaiellaceae bacterium]|nr:divalent metal cation transporter [Gaiellaceae bacterium]